VRAIQCMQFPTKSAKNELKPMDFLQRNFYFETEGVTSILKRREYVPNMLTPAIEVCGPAQLWSSIINHKHRKMMSIGPCLHSGWLAGWHLHCVSEIVTIMAQYWSPILCNLALSSFDDLGVDFVAFFRALEC
jgi:hypothetical protein